VFFNKLTGGIGGIRDVRALHLSFTGYQSGSFGLRLRIFSLKMSKITYYITPAKFTFMALHFILLISLIETYPNNVDAGTDDESPDSYPKSDAEFLMILGLSLAIIMLSVEVIIIFLGHTLFFDKSNMIQ
jgi:hypothetical protein